MSVLQARRALRNAGQSPLSRAQFLAGMSTLLGANQRILYTPNGTDTTSSVESSTVGRTIPWDGDISSRISRVGNANAQSFNGTSQYGEMPDTDDLSFGNGTADSAFTVLALINISAITTEHTLLAKWRSGLGEWRTAVDSGGLLRFWLQDESAAASPTARTLANGILTGVWTLCGFTYTAATGGATAANDMYVYVNGVDRTGNRVNAASYVAMENLTSESYIGTRNAHLSNFFPGSLILAAVTQKALTAAEHRQVHALCRRFTGQPL